MSTYRRNDQIVFLRFRNASCFFGIDGIRQTTLCSSDSNDDLTIPATIVIESDPFEPIAANNQSGSESGLKENTGEVICRLANTTWYAHES